jgi:parallel beta-helix repeat protein
MQAIGADANDWGKHFRLMADVNLAAFTGTQFNIIGSFSGSFSGVFDGSGHTISNFTYTSAGANYIGLFGYVTGVIKDLGLIDAEVDAGTGTLVGSLVGYLYYGTITNCYVEGGSVSGYSRIGGLVGHNRSSTIFNCHTIGSISGDDYVGGLVGTNEVGTITNCYASGSVSGQNRVGGLVGFNHVSCSPAGCSGGMISNCYATSSVSGYLGVGGLVGENRAGITNCYSVGSVSGTTDVGGLVGYDSYGVVIASFWDVNSTGVDTSAGGIGLTTDQMQTASTFAGWGCGSIWTIDEGKDYPRLWWQNMPGEIISKPYYGGGNGEPNDPYLIYTAEQLNTIGLAPCDWDKHFRLMADTDLGDYTGTSYNIIRSFSGVFDGSSHTISNFTYISNETSSVGVFGHVNGGEIENLGLIDPNVDAGTGRYVGSLVGYLKDGTITNCYVEGGSVSGGERVGGLVGYNGGTITNSYASGSVTGIAGVGGLVGFNGFRCINPSTCYYGTIINCYSTGEVAGATYVGGLVGENRGNVATSFWDIETSGRTTSAGGTGLQTAEMQMQNTFTDAGWDFTTPIWKMCYRPAYPRLYWEECPALRKIYVDTDATDTNDGSNWANAYKHLQDALAIALYGDEIRVAQGTYTPDRNSAHPNGSGDREATFQLISGVTIKGGYAGFGEPDPNARDIQLYETTLSGDLAGNDEPGVTPSDLLNHPSRAENSYHVVTGSGTETTAVLDGFIISGGNAYTWPDYYQGGGMYNSSGNPTVNNCTFTENSADWGGGIHCDESSPMIYLCKIKNNSAERGGGISCSQSSPIIRDSTISNNSVSYFYYGGGIYCDNRSEPNITSCIIEGNNAYSSGGGISCRDSNAIITDCAIIDNLASYGAGISLVHSNPSIANCRIKDNFAYDDAGGMYIFRSNPTIINCTISNNSAGCDEYARGGGGMLNEFSNPILIEGV